MKQEHCTKSYVYWKSVRLGSVADSFIVVEDSAFDRCRKGSFGWLSVYGLNGVLLFCVQKGMRNERSAPVQDAVVTAVHWLERCGSRP